MTKTTSINGQSIISPATEEELKSISVHFGGKVFDIRSQTSKTRAISFLRKGREETIYYMRGTGLIKGKLQVLVRPAIGTDVDTHVLGMNDVMAHSIQRSKKRPTENTRHVFNSSFHLYNNRHKGDRDEPFGYAYYLDIQKNFNAYEIFLAGFLE